MSAQVVFSASHRRRACGRTSPANTRRCGPGRARTRTAMARYLTHHAGVVVEIDRPGRAKRRDGVNPSASTEPLQARSFPRPAATLQRRSASTVVATDRPPVGGRRRDRQLLSILRTEVSRNARNRGSSATEAELGHRRPWFAGWRRASASFLQPDAGCRSLCTAYRFNEVGATRPFILC